VTEQTKLGSGALASGGADTVRTYEDAATAIGRLDAAACLADSGLRELLVLRCIATATGSSYPGMIALARSGGEGEQSESAIAGFGRALREGAARSRGGALPTLASLHELLRLGSPGAEAAGIDAILRDAHERTPPVLKAALAAHALRAASRSTALPGSEKHPTAPAEQHLAALAVPLLLCVGGAITDAWVTLPHAGGNNPGDDAADAPPAVPSLREIFAALAREARAAQRGLLAARELCVADETRVRDALGRAAYSALDVLALLREQIVITVPDTARTLAITPPTAGAAVARLVELGIAREVTGKARSRAFAYERMVHALRPSAAG
jgi:hypothetical protein